LAISPARLKYGSIGSAMILQPAEITDGFVVAMTPRADGCNLIAKHGASEKS